MEVLSKSTSETKDLALRVAKTLRGGDVLALYGDLGSGKTTFVQGLLEALNSEDKVVSPTFVLIRHYKCDLDGIKMVHHIDLYRVTNIDEALHLGIFELAEDKKSLTIIEWPDLLDGYLPKNSKEIKFEVVDETTRKIYVPDLS